MKKVSLVLKACPRDRRGDTENAKRKKNNVDMQSKKKERKKQISHSKSDIP